MSFKVLCESGGEDCCVHRAESQEAVTCWLDIVLYAVTRGRFSLMSELNEIQSECNDDEMERFPNKFTIPLMIVNLVLQPYGLWIKEGK